MLAPLAALIVAAPTVDADEPDASVQRERSWNALRAMDCARGHGRNHDGWAAPSPTTSLRDGPAPSTHCTDASAIARCSVRQSRRQVRVGVGAERRGHVVAFEQALCTPVEIDPTRHELDSEGEHQRHQCHQAKQAKSDMTEPGGHL
jgi:hypothetical protein